MTANAFLAMSAPALEAKSAPLPTFVRRPWYNPHRVDARPVIWSLRNRPEDWKYTWATHRNLTLTHKPSGHKLWASGVMGYKIDSDSCSCTGRAWQFLQFFAMGRAVRAWKRWEAKNNPEHHQLAEQFSAHFIR